MGKWWVRDKKRQRNMQMEELRNRKQGWHWGERQTYSMIESFRWQ
jgi:hypothetical protein